MSAGRLVGAPPGKATVGATSVATDATIDPGTYLYLLVDSLWPKQGLLVIVYEKVWSTHSILILPAPCHVFSTMLALSWACPFLKLFTVFFVVVKKWVKRVTSFIRDIAHLTFMLRSVRPTVETGEACYFSMFVYFLWRLELLFNYH